MTEFPNHLCPLCGSVLEIAETKLTYRISLRVKIECSKSGCLYSKTYDLTVKDIHKNGY